MGKYEVTQAQWEAVMGTTVRQQRDKIYSSSNLRGIGGNYPIYSVCHEEAVEFCRKLSSLTGRTYRLPTEAEWEYAARGGNQSRGYKYSGSNDVNSVAWYLDNGGETTHAVGTKRANELGLYDMSGNVWEWCSDWYGDYSTLSQTNPQGPGRGDYRVLRGGSWRINASGCRVSVRSYHTPSNPLYNLGFRVVLEP
jgi:formylglycine-generating enzyme required for sulfatase activity